MRIAERLARLESGTGRLSWAAMCTANERHMRRQAYQKAMQLAEKLGVTLELHEPPAPDPVALAAYDRKYGEQIRAEAPATMAKLTRLFESRAREAREGDPVQPNDNISDELPIASGASTKAC